MYKFKIVRTVLDLGNFLDRANEEKYEIITIATLGNAQCIIYIEPKKKVKE